MGTANVLGSSEDEHDRLERAQYATVPRTRAGSAASANFRANLKVSVLNHMGVKAVGNRRVERLHGVHGRERKRPEGDVRLACDRQPDNHRGESREREELTFETQ